MPRMTLPLLPSLACLLLLTSCGDGDGPVGPGGRSPQAQSLSVSTVKNTPVEVRVAASDPDGDALTARIVTGPSSGSVSDPVVSAGFVTMTYVPSPGFSGQDRVVYEVSDGRTTADATIDILVANQVPVAEASTHRASRSSVTVLTLTGRDSDGDALAFEIVGGPAKGSLGDIRVLGAGEAGQTVAEVDYTPDPADPGDDAFRFRVTDGDEASGTVEVTVDVNEPVAVVLPDGGPALEVHRDTPAQVELTLTDPEGDPLAADVTVAPEHGSVEVAQASATTGATDARSASASTVQITIIYTPDDGFTGGDTFTVRFSDGVDVVEIVFVVNVSNGVPVAFPASEDADEGVPVQITLLGGDPDGDPLSFQIASAPSLGTLGAVEAVGDGAATVTYTPGAPGGDAFDFTVSDGAETSEPATVTLTVNGVPEAMPGTAQTRSGVSVTIRLEGTDAEPGPLGFAVAEEPGHGRIRGITPVGDRVAYAHYTPDDDFVGEDAFTFTVSDSRVGSAPARVDVRVDNRGPRPDDQAVTVEEDGAVVVTLTGTDPGGGSLTFSIGSGPAHGALGALSDPTPGSADVTYTPAADYFGEDSFTFQVTDEDGATRSGTVDITVTPVNESPSFTPGGDEEVLEDAGAQSVAWAAGVSAGPGPEAFGPGGGFTVDNDNNGLFAVQPAVALDGTLTYTPAPDANGSADVTVTLDDGEGMATAPASFTIDVTPVNDPPSFTQGADPVVLEDSGPHTLGSWATDIGPGGGADESSQTLSPFTVTNDNNALFAIQPDLDATGELTFTPADDAWGSATVTVELSDDGGTANGGTNTGQQTFEITVSPVNDVPSFTKGDDQAVFNDNTETELSVDGWAAGLGKGPANEAGQTLSFNVTNDDNTLFAAQPAVDADGRLTYTPKDHAAGSATVTVSVSDDGGTDDGGTDTSPEQTFTIDMRGPVVLAMGLDGETAFMDVNTRTELLYVGQGFRYGTFSPDGLTAYTVGDGQIREYDMLSMSAVRTITVSGMRAGKATVHPDGETMVVHEDDPRGKLWIIDLTHETAEAVSVSAPTWQSRPRVAADGTSVYLGTTAGIQKVDLVAKTVGTLSVATTSRRLFVLHPFRDEAYVLKETPDSSPLTYDLQIVDLATGSVTATVVALTGSEAMAPTTMAISPDGAQVLVYGFGPQQRILVVDPSSHAVVAHYGANYVMLTNGGHSLTVSRGGYVYITDELNALCWEMRLEPWEFLGRAVPSRRVAGDVGYGDLAISH